MFIKLAAWGFMCPAENDISNGTEGFPWTNGRFNENIPGQLYDDGSVCTTTVVRSPGVAEKCQNAAPINRLCRPRWGEGFFVLLLLILLFIFVTVVLYTSV